MSQTRHLPEQSDPDHRLLLHLLHLTYEEWVENPWMEDSNHQDHDNLDTSLVIWLQLGVDFHNLVTAIMFAPEKADKLTEGLWFIVAANIISLETMQQAATWMGNREYMNALHAYQDYSNTFV